MSHQRHISASDDIHSVVVPLFPERSRPEPTSLELAPMDDIPTRATTIRRVNHVDWAVVGVLAFDLALWIGVGMLVTWALSDVFAGSAGQ